LDSYLDIAERVLRAARRPLSPKAILTSAYRDHLVPQHLHGQTQHKTLQARISEDIVQRRDASLFFRPEPGLFFLREFLSDASIPEKFRVAVPTRRRIRELIRGPVLAVAKSAVGSINGTMLIEARPFMRRLRHDDLMYADAKRHADDLLLVRSFVAVIRSGQILSYRLGKYREGRDAFLHKRTIGFSTLVHREDRDLFNMENFGIIESGVRAAMIDLDIPPTAMTEESRRDSVSFRCLVWSETPGAANDLLAVISLRCPDWFEPLQRRLAMNDMQWLDLANPTNNLEDFDPWSQSVLQERHRIFDHA
jgi:hypothetical protein